MNVFYKKKLSEYLKLNILMALCLVLFFTAYIKNSHLNLFGNYTMADFPIDRHASRADRADRADDGFIRFVSITCDYFKEDQNKSYECRKNILDVVGFKGIVHRMYERLLLIERSGDFSRGNPLIILSDLFNLLDLHRDTILDSLEYQESLRLLYHQLVREFNEFNEFNYLRTYGKERNIGADQIGYD